MKKRRKKKKRRRKKKKRKRRKKKKKKKKKRWRNKTKKNANACPYIGISKAQENRLYRYSYSVLRPL
jgi:hypothetical protein